jgi:hypothetical protein
MRSSEKPSLNNFLCVVLFQTQLILVGPVPREGKNFPLVTWFNSKSKSCIRVRIATPQLKRFKITG